ncbi:glycosyltransferase family 4 protein [Streptosporangium sp. NPDC002544]|uniref:glycosyltransferase family 4 protein n=1 Tax=Streptosporangium sp. NPDC002544 TaxID=3154538 RepID=UPI0033297719
MSYRVLSEQGGKERHVDCLTREQLKRGHEVALAFRRGDTVPKGATVLPIRPTMLSRALAARSDVLAFAAEVAQALRNAGQADLVHLHGDHVEAAILGPVCRRRGIPLVLTVHGALARRHRQIARRAMGKVDAFIALGSRPMCDLVALGADPHRILTTSSGLDLAILSRLGSAAARDPGLIVSVGSLDPVKNHELVIEAVRLIRLTRPEVRLVIAGDGPERSRLSRLSGADGAIELVGQLPRDEVYGLLRRAQVFVLASRRLPGKGEGVPTAALEALALGTPVIVSSEASLDPAVPDSEAYCTFESGSLDDLVSVLGAVLDDEEKRNRMSARGMQAAASLNWPTVASRVEEWYQVALDAIQLRNRGR